MNTGPLGEGTLLNGRYRILGVVGRGGMGTVYRAEHTHLEAIVAIKELNVGGNQGDIRDELRHQFEREARILVKLSHPNLPRVSDSFIEEDRCFLVMDFVEGETLEEIIRRHAPYPLDIRPVLRWSEQLCNVLEYLHGQNPPIVFRDLKPANIMITKEQDIRLIDFGIARRFQAGATHDTTFFGSPGYSPPEQYGHHQTDPRSDIYSLGATLHHMLSDRDPALTPFKHPPLQPLNPLVPPNLDDLVAHCLLIDPDDRYQTVFEIRQTLRDIRRELEEADEYKIAPTHRSGKPNPKPETVDQASSVAIKPTRKKGRRVIMPAAATVLCALGIFGWYHWHSARLKPTRQVNATVSVSKTTTQTPLSLVINSKPPGLSAWVDNAFIGKTPTSYPSLTPGSHEVVVKAPSGSGTGDWNQTVLISPGKTVTVNATFSRPMPAGLAVTNITAYPGAQWVGESGPQTGIVVVTDVSWLQPPSDARLAVFFYQDDSAHTPLTASTSNSAYAASNGQLNVSQSIQATPSGRPLTYRLSVPYRYFGQLTTLAVDYRLFIFANGSAVWRSPFGAIPIPAGSKNEGQPSG